MKRPSNWDEQDLLGLIEDQRKESIDLDYKQSFAIQRRGNQADKSKLDLSKDVSAFANSAGGTLVYGMVEDGHLPTKLDPGFDPADITKEWIEQVINSGIQPHIDDIRIKQVELSATHPGRVAYVIEIPQSMRAPHQAADKKYYKRFNFESVAMEDYEIRDIMRRASAPDLCCTFFINDRGDLCKFIMLDARVTPIPLIVTIMNHAPTPAEYAIVKLFFDSRLDVTPTGNILLVTTYQQEFMGTWTCVVQVPRSIRTEMPLLQNIPAQLISGPINVLLRDKSILEMQDYLLGWEVHSPGMTTTSGSLTISIGSAGISLP